MSFLGTLGAGSLGSARGAIIINTSQAQQAAAQMRSVGQQIAQSMQPAQAGVQSFGNALNQLRGQIAAIGIAAVAFSRQGLFDADTIRSYRIQFTALLGDQQTAISQMESLTEQANLFGGSLESFFALGRGILLYPHAAQQGLSLFGRKRRLKVLHPLCRSTFNFGFSQLEFHRIAQHVQDIESHFGSGKIQY